MAQYGWALSDESVRKARRELHEVPETRDMSIEAVREQMMTRPDISMTLLCITDAELVILIKYHCYYNPVQLTMAYSISNIHFSISAHRRCLHPQVLKSSQVQRLGGFQAIRPLFRVSPAEL